MLLWPQSKKLLLISGNYQRKSKLEIMQKSVDYQEPIIVDYIYIAALVSMAEGQWGRRDITVANARKSALKQSLPEIAAEERLEQKARISGMIASKWEKFCGLPTIDKVLKATNNCWNRNYPVPGIKPTYLSNIHPMKQKSKNSNGDEE